MAQHFVSSYRHKELKCHRGALRRMKIFSQPSLTFLKKVKISVRFGPGIAKNWLLVINQKEDKSSSDLEIHEAFIRMRSLSLKLHLDLQSPSQL